MGPEEFGEVIAADVSAAIDAAQDEAASAVETAEQIAAAAMENERGHRIRNVEEELDECREALADLSEVTGGLTAAVMELRGAMLVLTPAPPSPAISPNEAEALIDPEPEAVETSESEAPNDPPPPLEPPRKKSFRARML